MSQEIALMPPNASPFVRAKYQSENLHSNTIDVVVGIMQDSMNILGHHEKATDNDVLTIIAENTIKLVLSNFKTLTIDELRLALEKGCNGTYKLPRKEGLRTLNIENIHFWIKSYYADDTRRIALNYYQHLLSMPKSVPTPEQQEETIKNACLAAYEDFKQGGKVPFTYRVIYDYLKKALNIKWAPDEVIEIKKVANENYERDLKVKKLGREITKNQFDAAIENKKSLELEMKKVALLYYFRKIKNNKQEIDF
jgi:hypothetical protein